MKYRVSKTESKARELIKQFSRWNNKSFKEERFRMHHNSQKASVLWPLHIDHGEEVIWENKGNLTGTLNAKIKSEKLESFESDLLSCISPPNWNIDCPQSSSSLSWSEGESLSAAGSLLSSSGLAAVISSNLWSWCVETSSRSSRGGMSTCWFTVSHGWILGVMTGSCLVRHEQVGKLPSEPWVNSGLIGIYYWPIQI